MSHRLRERENRHCGDGEMAALRDRESLARRRARGMRMLENVVDLVRRGVSEKGDEQRRHGEIGRTVYASVGGRRHRLNGTRAFNGCQTLET